MRISISLFFLLLIVTGCSPVKKGGRTIYPPFDVLPGIYVEGDEVFEEINREKNYCGFEALSRDSTIPGLARRIYREEKWSLNEEAALSALLDSLNAANKWVRPFYIRVVGKMYEKSDGAFTELLCLTGKQFVENNTREFAAYFTREACLNNTDMNNWADVAVSEIVLTEEPVETYCKKLLSNCENAPLREKKVIENFTALLKKKRSKFPVK